ncbi:Bifunctional heparan sulfate N-deacetylase/N-sulfotransferase [Vespula maculifrons]|uniref:Heparan sulfate-N-deacetylase N-terminal domain-containing protein n=4 Tax=Vespula TaxID=7451 RepID=A0A834KPK2_VESGE|nr:hypothetical protein HZH66_004238 [Vespula vulgaris]KAF7410305.1 hypothetical protein HZH68_004686 [Vespula germanica]KAF7432230.1 hypothetical protein H0235_005154 [Vespula pensylvanica]
MRPDESTSQVTRGGGEVEVGWGGVVRWCGARGWGEGTQSVPSSRCTRNLIHRDTRPEPSIRCSTLKGATRLPSAPDHRSEARLRIDPKVLVFVETLYSRLGREIAELLVYNRIK